jgi:uncharacterized protein YkwD
MFLSGRGDQEKGNAVRARIVMPIVSALVAFATTLVIALVATSAPADAAAAPAARSGSARAVGASFDSAVLYWTNVERRQHGLRPLKAGPCVDKFAERWTARMASRNYFAHQSLRPILKRCHRHAAAENIAYGGGRMSAYQVVQMWMHSAGHRANILNGRYKALGVGTYQASNGRVFVTQDFAG